MKLLITYLAVALLLTSQYGQAQVKIEEPQKKHATAFAIVVDQETYIAAKDAVHQYRNAVEADGLSAYIVSGKFPNPDVLKAEIVKLRNRKIPLEGIVLIGELPVVLIRNAQHLTTAFKMNEEQYAIDQSSVPSDRFYDDLKLKFDYIQQDVKNKLHFYYRLNENGPQQLHPDFYSARIRYPKAKGGNAHQAIAAYLIKASLSKKKNKLDHLVAYTGAGYNSECLVAWKDDLKAYKEEFPYAFQTVNSAKQLNFRMNNTMKYAIFDEYQRPEVDVFIMRKHGTATEELMNNQPEGTSFDTRYAQLRQEIYAEMRRSLKRGASLESLKSTYQAKYNLLPEFFNQLQDPEQLKQDSIAHADLSIHTQDLRTLITHPKFIILDACYNGSFHEDDYIAGNYIFNAGQTVAVHGNTRNVLQDKWTMELSGILARGARIGQFNKLTSTLESHLIGDPTYRFSNEQYATLSNDIVLKATDQKFWRAMLAKDDPALQALSLRLLADQDVTGSMSDELFTVFTSSPYHTVRLEALKLLSRYNGANFLNAVTLGLNDGYEMIARQSAIYAGKIADVKLLPVMLDGILTSQDRKRVTYDLNNSLAVFSAKDIKEQLDKILSQANYVDKAEKVQSLQETINSNERRNQKISSMLSNTTVDADRKINEIRFLRNYNDPVRIAEYLKLLANPEEDVEVRKVMAEALGWYNHSSVKDRIVATCHTLLKNKEMPEVLQKEIIQTVIRLK